MTATVWATASAASVAQATGGGAAGGGGAGGGLPGCGELTTALGLFTLVLPYQVRGQVIQLPHSCGCTQC